jgi:hypothetical protein
MSIWDNRRLPIELRCLDRFLMPGYEETADR